MRNQNHVANTNEAGCVSYSEYVGKITLNNFVIDFKPWIIDIEATTHMCNDHSVFTKPTKLLQGITITLMENANL